VVLGPRGISYRAANCQMFYQHKWDAGVWVLLICAMIGLLVQNWRLSKAVGRLTDDLTLRGQVVPGRRVRSIAGLSLDGRSRSVDLPVAGSHLLVVTFSPGCPACLANQEGWERLAKGLPGKGWSLLWLSRSSVEATRDYCVRAGIAGSTVLADPPYRTYTQFGLARVPNTIVIGPNGLIEKVWVGQLDANGWSGLFAYFGAGGGLPVSAQPTGGNGAIPSCESGASPAPTKGCK